MSVQSHSQMANFIRSICNLLRGLEKIKAYIAELEAETVELLVEMAGKIDVRKTI
ncbi:MAG: hypothetical protein NT166_05365 [Candidatus Aminicenantes bacterium]|nr:hypothetical protein [Candidatus Aminicenantes bacterium]